MLTFKQLYKAKEEEFLTHCRQKFINVYNADKLLSVEEYEEFVLNGANSYERYLLYERASQELVIHLIKESLFNSTLHPQDSFTISSTYDDFIVKYLIHKL